MIETLDDWNERLGFCGCCQMTACPDPSLVHNVKPQTYSALCGFPLFNETDWTIPCADYRSRSTSYVNHITSSTGGDYTLTQTASRPTPGSCDITGVTSGSFVTVRGTLVSETYAAGVWIKNYDYYIGGSFIRSYTDTRTYSPMIGEAALFDELNGDAQAQIDATDDTDWIVGGSGSLRSHTSLFSAFLNPACYLGNPQTEVIRLTPYRFRFKIPSSHTGTFFKITYDIAEFPTDPLVDDSFVSEDNVVEWTGPGDPEDSEDATWLTDWIEIDPPDVPGERRVVNIRFTCYQGTKYGVKPQTTGESFTPPTP